MSMPDGRGHRARLAAAFVLAALAFGSTPAEDDMAPKLGRVMSPEEAQAWDLSVFPDGSGLPPGQGTAREGRPLFDALCASCHGPEGAGGSAPELAGGKSPLDSDYPDQNIGTYWPYATTIFDFTRRSMPMNAPGTLSDDQVYALTAWLLYANGIIAEDEVMNAETLPKVMMPNRGGFEAWWPDRGPPPP